MGFLGDLWNGACEWASNAFERFCDGTSLILNGLSDIGRSIGEGIKEICDKVGTEGMLIIGTIALALIIPGFGLPEILSLIQIVAQVAKILNVGGDDSPEELGMKAAFADKKPDDFESTEEYLKYLNEEVNLEPDTIENLSQEDKAKYGLMGCALEIKAIQEKYHVELSPEFLRDVKIMNISGEEVGAYVKDFSEKGITKMQDMTDYLRGNAIDTDKGTIYSSMLETMKDIYPDLSEEQLENRLCEMENELRENSI